MRQATSGSFLLDPVFVERFGEMEKGKKYNDDFQHLVISYIFIYKRMYLHLKTKL